MQTSIFKDLKQTLSENGYHHNGDKWGAAIGLFFDIAAFVYEENDVPREWNYRPGAFGNTIDTDSYNHEWLNSLNADQRLSIGNYLYRLTNILEKNGLSY